MLIFSTADYTAAGDFYAVLTPFDVNNLAKLGGTQDRRKLLQSTAVS